jgi:hypothetical protein
MVPPTRRRLLQVATAAAAGLAGCSGLAGEEASSSRSVSSEGGATIPGGTSEPEPEAVLLRADTDRPPVRPGGFDETPTDTRWNQGRLRRLTTEVVDSRSRADKLTVADAVDAEAVSSFLSATDFEKQTVYLDTRRVEACFRLELCSIAWTADDVQTNYVRQIRPYDERCSDDNEVFEARLIRIPAALEADSVNSYGSSTSGGGRCGDRRAGATSGSGSSSRQTAGNGGGA